MTIPFMHDHVGPADENCQRCEAPAGWERDRSGNLVPAARPMSGQPGTVAVAPDPVAAFLAAVKAYDAAGVVLRDAAAALPELPVGFDDGGHVVRFVEVGYERWEKVEDGAEEGSGEVVAHAYSDGWDSMSEGGAAEWIVVGPFGDDPRYYRVPDDLDWD